MSRSRRIETACFSIGATHCARAIISVIHGGLSGSVAAFASTSFSVMALTRSQSVRLRICRASSSVTRVTCSPCRRRVPRAFRLLGELLAFIVSCPPKGISSDLPRVVCEMSIALCCLTSSATVTLRPKRWCGRNCFSLCGASRVDVVVGDSIYIRYRRRNRLNGLL